MCGIAGIFDTRDRAVMLEDVTRMTDALAHRGPDGEGQVVDRCVGLGHRRLAILDLSDSGRQPMETPDGRYSITYNGEVYNYRELKDELASLGWRFSSTTDTEVVLYAFAQWGEEALSRFNGMFAFAVWDSLERKLFLARDRYGIKPLYYTMSDGCLLFGSEQKAIQTHPRFRRELDLEALVEYFSFQNIFTNRTFLRGVSILPSGTYAWIGLGDDTPAITHFWDYDFREARNQCDEREYVEELDRLFQQAVRRQLVSDVEVCTYLSGGIDSGGITAVASSQLPYIKSFTCGFDLSSASGLELSFDERGKAEALSALFKTEHYEMVLKAGDMERCLPRLAWHLEEPRVGQSYPNFYVAQLASKFGKVVLAGTGGDEMFGGYPWRYYRAAISTSFDDFVDNYYAYWQRLIPGDEIRNVFAPVWGDVRQVSTKDIFRSVFQRRDVILERPEDYINHSLYFEAKTFLHGLLVVEDKLSMAHGLETRVPFLDNDLVDFAMRNPVRFKLQNLGEVLKINENELGKLNKFFHKTRDGKQILRKVLGRYVPNSVATREKQGFSAPDASWFKGESIEFVRRKLLSGNPKIFEYMDRKTITKLVGDHLEGRENRRLLIWSLLNFEELLEGGL